MSTTPRSEIRIFRFIDGLSRQVVHNRRSGVWGKLVRKTGPLNGKLCAQRASARAVIKRLSTTFRAIIMMQGCCNVTTDLVGVNKTRVVPEKQRLSRNIASVRRYNARGVGHSFHEFYLLLLTIFHCAPRNAVTVVSLYGSASWFLIYATFSQVLLLRGKDRYDPFFLRSERFQLSHDVDLSRNFLTDLYHHVKAMCMKFESITTRINNDSL